MLCYHITFSWQKDANYAISKNSTSYINRKWQHLTTKWACTKLQAQSRLDSLASFRTNQIICLLMYVPVAFKFKFCYLFAYEYKYKQHNFFNYCSGFYCSFARDVTAAMLVVKNKTVSLRWELNSIFMQILRNKIVLYWPPTWPPCHVVANQEFWQLGDFVPDSTSKP